jgi:hypothetical protein
MESSLILTIDNLGKRYGMLPSEIIVRANTFDLVIMDTAMSLERHFQDSSKEGYIPEVTTEELLKIKERA